MLNSHTTAHYHQKSFVTPALSLFLRILDISRGFHHRYGRSIQSYTKTGQEAAAPWQTASTTLPRYDLLGLYLNGMQKQLETTDDFQDGRAVSLQCQVSECFEHAIFLPFS